MVEKLTQLHVKVEDDAISVTLQEAQSLSAVLDTTAEIDSSTTNTAITLVNQLIGSAQKKEASSTSEKESGKHFSNFFI